jgi:hypothetical protein
MRHLIFMFKILLSNQAKNLLRQSNLIILNIKILKKYLYNFIIIISILRFLLFIPTYVINVETINDVIFYKFNLFVWKFYIIYF